MIRINLLPVRAEKRKEVARQQLVLAVGIVVVMAAGIVAVDWTLRSDIANVQAQIKQRKARIAQLQKQIGEVKAYKKKKRDLEEKIGVIAKLEARQRGPVRVLDELARLMPEKMWIERLSDASGALSLDGFAIDNQTIARFMTRLQASPRFSGVRLEVTRQVTRAGVNLKSFSIRASVVYPKAG